MAEDLCGQTVSAATGQLPHRPAAFVRAALFHLLWRQTYAVDLDRPLSPATVLQKGHPDG